VGMAAVLIMAVVMVVMPVVIVSVVVAVLGHLAAYYTPIGYLASDGFDSSVTEPTSIAGRLSYRR